MAGVGVGEGRLEPVVGAHPGEEPGLGHLGSAPAPGAGGVVEHDAVRDAADVPEGVLEPLADALGRLAGEQLAEPHVGVGEAEREEVHARLLPLEDHVDVAEVGLRLAGRPHQLHEGHVRRPHLGPPLAHVSLHDAVAALVGRLPEQALVDPLGGVALLAPHAPVRLQNGVDERLVGVELGSAPGATGILGEKSSMARYLRIVGCDTPVSRCISALLTPLRLMSRILSIIGMLIIPSSSLPGSW